MVASALTPTAIGRATNGYSQTGGLAAANVAGNYFLNTGREAFIIANASVSPITVTFATSKTIDGLAVADLAVVVAAGITRIVGPFPPDWYNDASSFVQVTYSDVTTLTVAVIRLTPEQN